MSCPMKWPCQPPAFAKASADSLRIAPDGAKRSLVEMGGIEPPSEMQNLQHTTLIVCL